MIQTAPPMRRALVFVAIVVIAVTAVIVAGSALGAAQPSSNISTKAPYYANESSSVNNGTWYGDTENATLDSMGEMATRFVSYYIGYGGPAPDGAGFEGILITGIVMVAMFAGAVLMLPIGSVGGAVLAVVVGYGMTEMGLAPGWFRVVLIFVVGMLIFVAYRQSQQAR